jgi:chromosome segregation ATPase
VERALATRETVFKACDELLLSGQYPSARSVVAITKGSLSTVGPLRDEWWRQLAASYRDTKFLKGVPAEISEFLTGVWTSACDHAANRFDAQAAQLEAQLADARQAHEQAVQRASDAEAALTLEKSQSALLSDRVAQLKIGLGQAATQLADTREAHRLELASLTRSHADKLSAAEAARADASRAHAEEIVRRDEERRRLMLQIDASRQETIRVSEASLAAAAQHELAVQAATQRLDQAASQIRELSTTLAAARAESASIASQLAASQVHASQLLADREALATQLQAAQALIQSQAKVISDQVQASREMGETLSGFQALLSKPAGTKAGQQPRATRQK